MKNNTWYRLDIQYRTVAIFWILVKFSHDDRQRNQCRKFQISHTSNITYCRRIESITIIVGYRYLPCSLPSVLTVHTIPYYCRQLMSETPSSLTTPDKTAAPNTVEYLFRNKNSAEILPKGDCTRKGVDCLETIVAATPAGMKVEPGPEPDLLLLGQQAQDFILSQGITTVRAFLSLDSRS